MFNSTQCFFLPLWIQFGMRGVHEPIWNRSSLCAYPIVSPTNSCQRTQLPWKKFSFALIWDTFVPCEKKCYLVLLDIKECRRKPQSRDRYSATVIVHVTGIRIHSAFLHVVQPSFVLSCALVDFFFFSFLLVDDIVPFLGVISSLFDRTSPVGLSVHPAM